MIIDTIFNPGDDVCYLMGETIYHTTVRRIEIEVSIEFDGVKIIYKLADGLSTPITAPPTLFKNTKDLQNFLFPNQQNQ